MWADLGFWRDDDGGTFHIHGVTGPDEYTTVVNDNLFTNVMARFNLRRAAEAVRRARARSTARAYDALVGRLGLERRRDRRVGAGGRGDGRSRSTSTSASTRRTRTSSSARCGTWRTRRWTKRPLLLHYHPLVIYRFQVLKQADVVLALFLQGEQFTAEQKRADFEYYDPITTGDSTLSAVVQSIIAAEVGYDDLALRYFLERAVRRPRRPARQHHRRRARRLDRRRVERAGLRLRRLPRPRRPLHARPAAPRDLDRR